MKTDSKNINQFATGGLVPSEDGAEKRVVSQIAKILVCKTTYKTVGAEMLRALNGSPFAEIIVIPDKKFYSMSPSEKILMLNT